MKVGLVGVAGVPLGKHKVKDARLDQADKLVKADNKTYAFDDFWVHVVRAGGYISFLTVGGSENRAWLIRKGSTAQEAGGAIHTDIQKGFIRVEIIGYDDFVAAGGETQAKHANKMRVETKS